MNLNIISRKIEDERFLQRVKILYYGRIFILLIAISILTIPFLKEKFNVYGIVPFLIFLFMVVYSTVNYYIKNIKILRNFTFMTLIFDNLALVSVIVKSGGLQSPILSTQIVFLIFFITLFPKPLYILPPLLMLPIITRVDLLLGKTETPIQDIFTIIWLSALNIIIIYFIVLLESKVNESSLKIYQYQNELKDKSILEEKNKIARDLHDGVGGALSSLIIQSEYILSLTDKLQNEELVSEIKELKHYAEESMDEIRRSLNVIKNNFNFEQAVIDFLDTFEERNKVTVDKTIIFDKIEISHKEQLSLFRVFQETMSNSLKHSGCKNIKLVLKINQDSIYIYVEDKGKGFDTNKNYVGHFGLKNLKERVNLLNGKIDIYSEIGNGTKITIDIPNQFASNTEQSVYWHF